MEARRRGYIAECPRNEKWKEGGIFVVENGHKGGIPPISERLISVQINHVLMPHVYMPTQEVIN